MDKIRIAINGFGRMGRLALRAAWGKPEFEFCHINEKAGDSAAMAHLLQYDSVHGTWDHRVSHNDTQLIIDDVTIDVSHSASIEELPWLSKDIDVVIDCTGKFKDYVSLSKYLQGGCKQVVVSAPVKNSEDHPEILNIVMGVNDKRFDENPTKYPIVTAASCTTNCIAPVVDVLLKRFGIKHGCINTIHDVTNTQSVLDGYHKDLRRARASSLSLIPTSTGSATAITAIFPELQNKIDGIAIRVPLANASLTDCVFELQASVTVAEINAAFAEAAAGYLQGILGYEEKPLVSCDYTDDPRSGIVDGASTMVVDGTQVKLLVWYDNEWGYVNRMMELAGKVGVGR